MDLLEGRKKHTFVSKINVGKFFHCQKNLSSPDITMADSVNAAQVMDGIMTDFSLLNIDSVFPE